MLTLLAAAPPAMDPVAAPAIDAGAPPATELVEVGAGAVGAAA
jgi:hypothetical protein